MSAHLQVEWTQNEACARDAYMRLRAHLAAARTSERKDPAMSERDAALDLGALMRSNPAEGRARVIGAFEKTKGNAVHAAELLGISRTTLRKYMKDTAIAAAVERARGAS